MSRFQRELIRVEGVPNFRGLGGIPSGDKKVRKGLIFRCAVMSNITPSGIETLKSLHIANLIDLRNEKEILENPDKGIESVNAVHFDFTKGSLPGVTREELETQGNLFFLKKAPPMDELYRFMMDEEHIGEVVNAVRFSVDSLLKGEPLLYHCSAGKDRTGILSCLLLTLLGVSKEAIFEDYLYTNKWAKKQARRYCALVSLRAPYLMKKTYNLFIAKRSFLEAVYSTIDSSYGGMKNFIENILGIDEVTRVKLQEACLE